LRLHDALGKFKTQPAAERFAAKTLKTETCWLWQGPQSADGYGTFTVGRRTIRAHRFAWLQATGEEPGELLVCHHCDRPLCVNPGHLFLGTTQDNTADKVSKGRQNAGRGDRHGSVTKPETFLRGVDLPQAKLTEADVRRIRQLAAEGGAETKIAAMFGVCRANVRKVVLRKSWRHVA
jgi:hypothetical protein